LESRILYIPCCIAEFEEANFKVSDSGNGPVTATSVFVAVERATAKYITKI